METFGSQPKPNSGDAPNEPAATSADSTAAKPKDGAREPIRQSLQVGNQSQLRRQPDKEKTFIVDEDREVSVMVLYSTVTFRPNQLLREIRDKRLIEVAKDNGIRLRAR